MTLHNRSVLMFLLLFGVTPELSGETRPLRIGVWNIEVLSNTANRGFPELVGSDALPPRSAEDLAAISEYLKDELEVDALMVTEIAADGEGSTENRPESAQLSQIAAKMGPEWRYFLGRTGDKMRLGLLFNENRVQLKKLVNLDAEEFHVSGKDVFDRDPFIVWIDALDNGQTRNDLLLICVHLKSQQKPFRHNRMAAIAKLLGDIGDKDVRRELGLPSLTEEQQVFILGDCNDASHRETGFKFMFDYLNGVGFSHLRPTSGAYPRTRINGSQIDHIFAAPGASSSIAAGSFQVHTVSDTEEDNAAYRQTYSDHFPLTVDLPIVADTDLTLLQVLALTDPNERAQRLAEQSAEILALAAPVEELDDEDLEPRVIRAEVIDGEFERILAPRSTPQAINR